MKTVCKENSCNGCMACINVCPKSCISIVDNISSLNAIIDTTKCIKCKRCEKVCPNNTMVKKVYPIEWKQGWATDDIRCNSTSGGVASEIVISFIESGGYVAACLFEKGNFIFKLTNDLNLVRKFAGSKYVKSNPESIYKEIRNKLKTNKVLFIGLPCQVAGIKNYIKEDKNLYTIDLICHGTPSVKLLDIYLRENNINISELKDIKFRNKNDMGLRVDGKRIKLSRVTDAYLCTFLSSINYTENCYTCNYASIERISDITLGDSWGTKLKDEIRKGISLILIQSKKGLELINNSDLELYDVDLNNAISNNHQLSHPSIRTGKRDKFIQLIRDGRSYRFSAYKCLPAMMVKQNIKAVLITCKLLHEAGGYGIEVEIFN